MHNGTFGELSKKPFVGTLLCDWMLCIENMSWISLYYDAWVSFKEVSKQIIKQNLQEISRPAIKSSVFTMTTGLLVSKFSFDSNI